MPPLNPAPLDLPIADLADALRRGELTPVELAEMSLQRVSQRERQLFALVSEPDRPTRLSRDAATLAAAPGAAELPLYGIPVGVKDIFRVGGWDTAAGSLLPPEILKGPEAELVGRFRDLGALFLGRCVTTEFAYFEPGPTANPAAPGHTPGGSSSGSAAAVAAGYCPIALGSQTVGSVLRPAAFCGITGFKPSQGRLSIRGAIPYAPSLDQAGLFANTPADMLWLAARVVDSWVPSSAGGMQLGVPDDAYLRQAEPAIRARFEEVLVSLRAAGWEVRPLPLFPDIDAINARHEVICRAEMATVHAEWFRRFAPLYRPRTARQIEAGMAITPAELKLALGGRRRIQERVVEVARAGGVDCWISPAAVSGPPPGLSSTGSPLMSLPWTHAGVPAIAIPAGMDANSLPFGLQISAGFGQDELLLSSAVRLWDTLCESGDA